MMLDLFKRMARAPAFDAAGLGAQLIAKPMQSGCALPPGAVGVAVDAGTAHLFNARTGMRVTA